MTIKAIFALRFGTLLGWAVVLRFVGTVVVVVCDVSYPAGTNNEEFVPDEPLEFRYMV